MRLVALWLLLFAVYAIGDEPTSLIERDYLQIATTLLEQGEVNRSALGLGFPALIAPLEGLGDEAVALVLAGVAALGFVLGALLARRIVPEPYASAGAALAGLSAPAVTFAATITPEMTAGTLLAGAALCTVAAREAPRAATVFGAAAMLAALPWLAPELLVPALPVGVALYVWCRRARHATMGLIAIELVVASLVLYVTLNERLYGGFTPQAIVAELPPTADSTLVELLDRLPRLVTLWLDPESGLLRWAPAFALIFHAAWLLRRSIGEGIARAVPERAGAEAAAGLSLAVVLAVVLATAFAYEFLDLAYPDRGLAPAFAVAGAPIAWSLRHAPRIGAALGAVTLAITAVELI